MGSSCSIVTSPPTTLVAPTDLRDGLVARVRREVAHVRAGRPGRIIAKMNSLVDRTLIEELYAASQALQTMLQFRKHGNSLAGACQRGFHLAELIIRARQLAA